MDIGHPFIFMKREAYSNSHKAICLRAAPELVFSKLKIVTNSIQLVGCVHVLPESLVVTQMDHNDSIMSYGGIILCVECTYISKK